MPAAPVDTDAIDPKAIEPKAIETRMIVPSIKSRPLYAKLTPRAGALHLFVVDPAGAAAVLDMAASAPPGLFAAAHVVLVASGGQGSDISELARRLKALQPMVWLQAPTLGTALPHLRQVLGTALMGTQLYLAGSEGLIGAVTRLALEADMESDAILAEHRGTLARRVQCVHCKGVNETVTTQPVTCGQCGLVLFVRDHYSRRLGAFQGVCIDAEEPGVVPAPEEIFA